MPESPSVSKREAVRVFVSGRVQGVWFRESTRQRATELGLNGWVRNLSDGRVEALFVGAPDAIEAALAFVAVGPAHARVSNVEIASREITNTAPESAAAGFRVR